MQADDSQDNLNSFWISSYPDEKGHYHVVLEPDQDNAIPMDATSATSWARSVLSAVAAAEYDAAVMRQLRASKIEDQDAVAFIMHMRADRATSISLSIVDGLSLTPGVSSTTGEAFLTLSVKDKQVGQWTAQDARQHALALLMSIEMAVMDGAYLRALHFAGMDRDLALLAVHNLDQHRTAHAITGEQTPLQEPDTR